LTYHIDVNETCVVCNQTNKFMVMVSFSSFGSDDLDFRPGGDAFGAVGGALQECPKCGYVNSHVSEKRASTEIVMHTSKFKKLQSSDIHIYAYKKLMKASLFYEAEGDHWDAGMYSLAAAWGADNMVEVEYADESRVRAALLFEKSLIKKTKLGENKLITEFRLLDIYRRLSDWEKSNQFATHLEVEALDEKLSAIFDLQLKLIKAKSNVAATVDQAMAQQRQYGNSKITINLDSLSFKN